LTYAKPYLAERFGAVGELKSALGTTSRRPSKSSPSAKKKERKLAGHNHALGPDSVLGKDMSIGPNAQFSVGDRHNETGIFEIRPEKALLIPSDGSMSGRRWDQ